MNKQKLDILIESEVTNQLTQEQVDWLNEVVDGKWKLENGVVNVKGDVDCGGQNLTVIPVQFGKISNNFDCYYNELMTLKNCPYEVGEVFNCWNNKLTSLEFMPFEIGDLFYCWGNSFILNDKLFEDLARIGGENKIGDCDRFIDELKQQISIQFGVTDKKVINKIWQSYMNIFEGKSE